MKKLLFTALLSLVIFGCTPMGTEMYSEGEVVENQYVMKGVVLKTTQVEVKGTKIISTKDKVAVGVIKGHAIEGTDTLKAVSYVNKTEASKSMDGWITDDEGGYQYIIKLRRDGEVIAIIQGNTEDIKVDDKVIILQNEEQTRVILNSEQ